ncbi:surface antigen D15, partial [Candidatus Gastranaerophilus sp. (ex Termes propinquus)]
ESNFRGLGQKINLNFMAGTGVLMSDDSVVTRPNLQAEISFYEPYFRNPYTSLAFRGFARNFGSYQVPLAIEERFGLDATVYRKFKAYKNLTGSLTFGFENVKLSEGNWDKISGMYNSADPKIPLALRDEQLAGGLYAKLTPGLVYDTRDNVLNTRRGVLASLSIEEAIKFSGDATSYGKLMGTLRKYIPAGRKSTVLLTARAGGKLNGDIPEFAAYSLGGPYNVRGFNIAEVGTGTGYMSGSAEFRTPIPFIDRLTTNTFVNNIRIAAFLDAGKMFDQTLTDRLYNRPGYAISAGAGLRIFVPGLGPINLDYGFPLTNTAGSRNTGFFTFGMGDMLY